LAAAQLLLNPAAAVERGADARLPVASPGRQGTPVAGKWLRVSGRSAPAQLRLDAQL